MEVSMDPLNAPDHAADVDADGHEPVELQPPGGRSRAETAAIARIYPPVTEDAPSKRSSFRFPISTLMLLTLAIAIGLSGHSWFSPQVFAGVLGIIANIVVFTFEWHQVDDPRLRTIMFMVCIASGVAIGIALLDK